VDRVVPGCGLRLRGGLVGSEGDSVAAEQEATDGHPDRPHIRLARHLVWAGDAELLDAHLHRVTRLDLRRVERGGGVLDGLEALGQELYTPVALQGEPLIAARVKPGGSHSELIADAEVETETGPARPADLLALGESGHVGVFSLLVF